MYSIILGLQYFCLLVILSGMTYIYFSKKSEYQLVILLIFASNLINQLAFIIEMKSTTLEGSLNAIKIAYYGKLCVLFFMLYFIMNYCKARFPAVVNIILVILNMLVFWSVWTCDRHSLYYKTIEFVEDGLYPHIETTDGPMHILFNVVVVSYMLAIFYMCIKCFIKAKRKIQRQRLICLIAVPVVVAVSYVVYKSGITKGYDCTSLAYLIDSIIMIYAIRKLGIIDYLAQAKEEIVDEMLDAVVVLNEDGDCAYHNMQAKVLFPDIDDEDKVLSIIDHLADIYNTEGETWINDRFYNIRKKEMMGDGKKVQSTIYTLTDNTNHYILTYIDGLTNVRNRRALNKAMTKLEKSENSWLVIMDIDSFKSINDSLGHQVGDDCIILFASTMADTFSKEAVYRYGGDEFVMLVNEEPDLLERKLAAINEKLSADTNEVPFHVSGGYVKLEPEVGLEELMKKADDALYIVKKSGKGRFARAM